MNKILGIFGLLVFVCLFTTVLNDSFVHERNLYNITRWSSLFGILSIGVAFVIITGGIDLSVGSVVGLSACLLSVFMNELGYSAATSIVLVILISAGIGLLHGLLITRLDLQPFVVTLCGLLIYRGLARRITNDATQGFGQDHELLRSLAIGKPCTWATLLMLGGVILLIYGVLTLARRRRRLGQDQGIASTIALWSVPAIGMLLAVIGSSRFWMGWNVVEGPIVIQWGEYAVRGPGIEIPQLAETRPSAVMKYVGAILFFPLLVLFSAWALRADLKRVLLPLLSSAGCLIMLAICVNQLVPIYQSVSPDELWQVGRLQLSGGSLQALLRLVAFVIVAGVVGSIGWFLAAAGKSSGKSRIVTPMLVAVGVMALLGHTNLVATNVPMPMLMLVVLAVLASVFLNQTVFGRYLLALGRNEEAARYSGINTKHMVVIAYVLCSFAAGLGGILFALDVNAIQPSGFGEFYELYAIAAAVLGGCSLRGGEGNILGVVIGAAVMRVLYNAINILGISDKLEFLIIGLVILGGAMVDVIVNRMIARRALLAREAAASDSG